MGPVAPFPAIRRLARWRVPLGFVVAPVALWFARPTPQSLVAGGAVAVLGEAIRVWAAGHLEKSREVTRSGPYRFVAHPLYAGSALMAVGFAIAAHHAGAALLVLGYIALTLWIAIVSEQAFLRERFGAEYEAWRAGRAPAVERRFSLERVLRNREWRAVLGLLAVFALLWLKGTVPFR